MGYRTPDLSSTPLQHRRLPEQESGSDEDEPGAAAPHQTLENSPAACTEPPSVRPKVHIKGPRPPPLEEHPENTDVLVPGPENDEVIIHTDQSEVKQENIFLFFDIS